MISAKGFQDTIQIALMYYHIIICIKSLMFLYILYTLYISTNTLARHMMDILIITMIQC